MKYVVILLAMDDEDFGCSFSRTATIQLWDVDSFVCLMQVDCSSLLLAGLPVGQRTLLTIRCSLGSPLLSHSTCGWHNAYVMHNIFALLSLGCADISSNQLL